MTEGYDAAGVAGVHAAITALSVSVGRLDERLSAIDKRLTYHTENEHAEFIEARNEVKEISKMVASLHSLVDQGKGANWAMMKVGALVTFVFGLIATGVAFWKNSP